MNCKSRYTRLVPGFVAGIVWSAMPAAAAIPNFSGAEGFGAVTPGGRGGQVLRVTNLNDSGPGSLRAALEASGPRIVVFDVAGRIHLESEISITNPYLTIAGQTAPQGGITVSGESVSLDTHDIAVRYVRFRRGYDTDDPEPRRDDSLGSDRTNSNDLQNPKTGNIIIDHVSASWGLDENLSIYRSKLDAPIVPGGSTVLPTRNVTVQWSISSEALNPFRHAFGSTLGGAGVNHHHNLWASNTGRNPSISFSDFMDFRNNVLFNWMHRSIDGAGPEAHVNIINNYYKPGPATGFSNGVTPQPIPELKVTIVEPELRSGPPYTPDTIGDWYVDGNFVEGFPEVSADNWEGESEVAPGVFARGVQFENPYPIEWARVNSPITHVERPDDPDDPFDDDGMGNLIPIPDLPVIATQSALEAFQSVLAGAGASLFRDAVDERVIESAMTGIATAGPRGDGIINHPDDVGGYPEYIMVTHPADWDTEDNGPGQPTGDGMPTWWELKHGLDPAADDHDDDFDDDGYTNLEDYLNEIGAFPAVSDITWDGELNNRYARIENWDISFQPSRFDTAVIHSGVVEVDAVGQHAGTLKIGTAAEDDAQLVLSAGWLDVADEVIIGEDDAATTALNQTGGELFVGRLSKGAAAQYHFTGGTLHADEVGFDLEIDNATLAPGRSIGTTTVEGHAVFTNGATLQIELSGDESDLLVVSGDLELGQDSALEIIELAEASTSSLVVAQYTGQLTGQFAAVTEGYTVDYDTPGTIRLLLAAPVLAGDYNEDGIVNAADYVMWRNNVGAGSLPNETASPGEIDMADYDVWRANFGATSALGEQSGNPVPEPATFVAALVVLAGLGCTHHTSKNPNFRVRTEIHDS